MERSEPVPERRLAGVHHFAFRCLDAEQTRWFYEDLLGFELVAAVEEVRDFGEPGVEPEPFMHLFFEMPDGNCVAFFDDPHRASPAHFARKDSFDVHLAFECASEAQLEDWMARLNEAGKTCLGPVDHGFVKSVYMYDPNGLQVEITCRAPDYEDQMTAHRQTVRDQLARWTENTRALKRERFGDKPDIRGRS